MSKQAVLEILRQLGKIGDQMEQCPVLSWCPITNLSQIRTLDLTTFNLLSSVYGFTIHLLIRTLLSLIKQLIPKRKIVNENKKNKSWLNSLHIFQVFFHFCLHSCHSLLSETWLPLSSLTALEMLGSTSLSGGEKLLENSFLGQEERRGSSSRFPYQFPSK